jgi:hypothetical protein
MMYESYKVHLLSGLLFFTGPKLSYILGTEKMSGFSLTPPGTAVLVRGISATMSASA